MTRGKFKTFRIADACMLFNFRAAGINESEHLANLFLIFFFFFFFFFFFLSFFSFLFFFFFSKASPAASSTVWPRSDNSSGHERPQHRVSAR